MPIINLVDAAITYRILKMLVTPWEKTDAYKKGIIDKNGNILKHSEDLSNEDSSSYTSLTRLVFKLKRILGKIPLVNKNLATVATALWLLKEDTENLDDSIILEALCNQVLLESDATQYYVNFIKEYNKENPSMFFTSLILTEDAPVNNVGSGNIEGTQGDSGRKKQVLGIVRRNNKKIKKVK